MGGQAQPAPQFTATVDGQRIHFVHARSPEPDAMALLALHGWPGSVVELHEVIGRLADPRAHGGEAADAFSVVAPSLPGFGFSGPTSEPGWDVARITGAMATLPERLDHYGSACTGRGPHLLARHSRCARAHTRY